MGERAQEHSGEPDRAVEWSDLGLEPGNITDSGAIGGELNYP